MSTRTGLDLGNEAIDLEHRVQVQLVDAMEEALRRGDPAGMELMAQQLLEFSNVHFGSEEVLMRFHSFPMYHVHVEEHRRLLDLLDSIRSAHSNDGAEQAPRLVAEVRTWLSSHILGMDRLFVEFIAQEGGEAVASERGAGGDGDGAGTSAGLRR